VQFRRKSKPEIAINMAPLIDVIFLLVIFFAVSTTFLETSGLKLELPTSSSTAQRVAKEVTVILSEDGRLFVNDEEATAEDLAGRLQSELESSEDKVVVLRADTHAEHGDVVRIMDLIRAAGAESLTVAARSAPGGE
jgi:biopolymer transport protein ExbD